MFMQFEAFGASAEDGATTDGRRRVDGELMRPVNVDLAEHRPLVTLSVGDEMTVDVHLDPFIAMLIGEALINAGLAVYFRPGGQLRAIVEDAVDETPGQTPSTNQVHTDEVPAR